MTAIWRDGFRILLPPLQWCCEFSEFLNVRRHNVFIIEGAGALLLRLKVNIPVATKTNGAVLLDALFLWMTKINHLRGEAKSVAENEGLNGLFPYHCAVAKAYPVFRDENVDIELCQLSARDEFAFGRAGVFRHGSAREFERVCQ